VHTEDLDDEGDKTESGDVIATEAEVRREIETVHRNKSLKRRLLRSAYLILQTTTRLRVGYTPEDLLADAALAVLERRRKWPTNRVDLPGLLVGVMKSLAWNREQTLTKASPQLALESDLQRPEGEESPLDQLAVDHGTPEQVLEESQTRAEEDAALTILRANFGPDELPGRILDEIRKREGRTQAEIRSALGVSESDYWNAFKAVRRAADNFNKRKG
jgi:uncharacterized membrane protein